MLEILYINGILNERTQKTILGIVLILKRKLKEEVKSLKEIKEIIGEDIIKDLYILEEEKVIKVCNELLQNEEKELEKAFLDEPQVKTVFDVCTPKNEAELMDYILDVKDNSTVLDLYSGEGKIDEVLVNNHKNIKIDGFEINMNYLEMAKLKMLVLNNKNVNYYEKDILTENIDKKYDYAIADIPFISRYDKEVQKSLEEIYEKMDLEISNRISTTWMTAIKMIDALKENGRAILTTVKGSLFNTLDREIRKILIDKGYIEAIIDLPNKIVPYTNVDISLIVLNKSIKNKEIKFVDLKKCSVMNGKVNIIDLEKAKEIYINNSINVDVKKIANNNYSLNRNIYEGKVEIENAVKLSIITEDIFRGYQITTSEINKMLVDNEEKMNYKILEISNINDDGEICSELKMINSKEKNLDRYLLKDGDIVISARGDKIKKCLINISDNEKIIANGSINVIRVNKSKIDPLYLKMFLESEKGTITLNNIKSGVTIPSINVGELQNLLVPCPSIEEQNKLIQKFEVKIEVIKSTAKRLEELKKELKNLADLI